MTTESRDVSSGRPGGGFAERVADNLNQVLELAKQPLRGAEFYRELISRVVIAVQADSGVIWKVKPGKAEVVARYRGDRSTGESPGDLADGSPPSLEAVLNSSRSVYEPLPGREGDVSSGTRSIHSLVRDPNVVMALELIHRKHPDWVGSPAYENIVNAIRELTLDFHRNSELSFLRNQSSAAGQLLQFAERVNRLDDPEAAAFEVANSACPLLGVERATVLVAQPKGYRILSVSGLGDVARQSDQVQALEGAVGAAVEGGLPATRTVEPGASLTGDDPVWDEYWSRTGAAFFSLHSLDRLPEGEEGVAGSSRRPAAVLLLESFNPPPGVAGEATIDLFCRLAAPAVCRSVSPAGPRGKVGNHRVNSRPRRRSRWPLVLGLLAVGGAVLFWIPAEMKIKATGQLLPVVRKGIYAPADGEIVSLAARHNDRVEAGQSLLTVYSSDLELRLTRLQGEYQSTLEKLQAIESRRIVGRGSEAGVPAPNPALLSASAEELSILRDSQEEQIEILRQYRQRLDVRSPIDGRVITWQLEKLLASRPVQRGQLLMTVADTDGEWEGELEIRDRRIGEILKAREETGDLEVTFFLISRPESIHSGKLEAIDLATGEDALGLPVVKAAFAIDDESSLPLRPGVRIIAKVHCGSRSLGYVWFHELVSAIRSAVF